MKTRTVKLIKLSELAKTQDTDSAHIIGITDQAVQIPAGAFKAEDGLPGKPAYEYAIEGGFSGTEEEFAAALANVSSATGVNILAGAEYHPGRIGADGNIQTS